MSNKPGGEYYLPRKKIDRDLRDHLGRLADRVFRKDTRRTEVPIRAKRNLFLESLERLEPEIKAEHGIGVIESLQADVLPFYSSHWTYAEEFSQTVGLTYVDEAISIHHDGQLSGYAKTLIEWVLRWNLTEEWLLDTATSAVYQWSNAGLEDSTGLYRGRTFEWPDDLMGRGQHPSDAHLSVEDLIKDIQPKSGCVYNPLTMRRREVMAKFDELQLELKNRFTNFLDLQDGIVEARGGKRTKNVKQPYQFDWLVRYQIQGWDDSAIARYYSDEKRSPKAVTDESVRKSRQRLAKEIGLRLR